MRLKRPLIMAAIVLLALLAGLLLASRSAEPTPVPPVASATPTPSLSQADQATLEHLSREFVGKYFSYTRPDDAAYLASIKPFFSPELYERIEVENKKASRFPNIPAQQSTVDSVRLVMKSADRVEAAVRFSSRRSGAVQSGRTVTIVWERRGERWSISEFTEGTQEQANG